MSKTKKRARRAAPPQAGPDGSDFVPIESIRPWKDNPRKNAHTVAKVQESIRRFGWIRPIIANTHPRAKGEIIVGHTAHLAALASQLTHVPVRWLKLTPSKAHAAALADNKLGEISSWDTDLLAEITKQGIVGLDDLSVAGFTPDELERLGKPPVLATGDFAETKTNRETQFKCPNCGHKWRAKSGRTAKTGRGKSKSKAAA